MSSRINSSTSSFIIPSNCVTSLERSFTRTCRTDLASLPYKTGSCSELNKPQVLLNLYKTVKSLAWVEYLHGTCHFEQSPFLKAGCVWLLWRLTSQSGCLVKAGQHLTTETLFSSHLPLSFCKRTKSYRVISVTYAKGAAYNTSARTHLVCAVGRMGSGSLLTAVGASVVGTFSA